MRFITSGFKFIDLAVDPFLMQLVIIPFVVIGLGVLAAKRSRKFIVGPFITFILTFSYNFLSLISYYPESELFEASAYRYMFGWCLIFPLISLVISYIIVTSIEMNKRKLLLS